MKKNKHLNNLALFTSFLGSPFIVLGFMFTTLAWHYKEGVAQFYSYITVTFIFVLIIPLAFMIENIDNFKLLDLHLTNKKDREKTLFVATFSVLMGYIMLSIIGMPKPLLLIELVGIINLIVVAFITLKMKMSIHLAVLTVATTLVVFFLGYIYAWLYILLLPLAWSRFYREKHTIPEVLTGIAISFGVTVTIIESFLIFGQ